MIPLAKTLVRYREGLNEVCASMELSVHLKQTVFHVTFDAREIQFSLKDRCFVYVLVIHDYTTRVNLHMQV